LTIAQLLQLIQQGESQTLDFKVTVTHKHKIAKTIASFANTKGGILLIGVRDDQQIIGVDPEEEEFSLREAATDYCIPPISLIFNTVEDKYGNTVLVVEIEESQEKPHYCLDPQHARHVYIRVHDKCLLAGKDVVKAMRQGRVREHISLSSHEKSLISYLEENERITVKHYAKLMNISERRAKRSLIELTRAGWLYVLDFNKEDFYCLA
jgi:predicted HTH transcriptional regulator